MATPEDILTKKIQRIYSQAAVEVKRKTEEFWSAHRRIASQMLADVAAGKITQADYKKWLRGQVFTGERWKQKLDDITKVYVDADKKAREIIGGTTKNVFVDMANRTAYDMEKELRGGVSFDLYDGKTVERLLKDNPKMLPEWKIDEPKDYIWNEKRVQNAVTQGIVQGESIADIGKRLTSELATSNGAKMDMFARTAVTGAQNAGRMERLHEAEEMGIEVKKQWIATHDQRVRDTHAYLDGQIVGVDEPFTVDGMEIDYPGDPLAPPELVYNCRCTLAYIYPKYQNQKRWEDQETGEEKEWKTFSEWKDEKRSASAVKINVKKEYDFKNDESFSAKIGKQELYPYIIDYKNYDDFLEEARNFEGERTDYIQDVRVGTDVYFRNNEMAYGGEKYCGGQKIDYTMAELEKKVPIIDDSTHLIVCDYQDAHLYLPKGKGDRRFKDDSPPIAQVFKDDGQIVIAFDRSYMNGTLQESLTKRQEMISAGNILPTVFPVESPETVVMHEWGHVIEQYYTHALVYQDETAKEMFDWWKSLSKDEIKHGISEYASENFGEFCAECFAEMQAENPRPIAVKYWGFMNKLIEKRYTYD